VTITFPPSFWKSWKTSVVGLLSAVYPVAQGFKAFQSGDYNALFHDPLFYGAMLLAINGWVSKDADVTGGTSGQPSSPKALIEANVAPSEVSPPKPVDSKL